MPQDLTWDNPEDVGVLLSQKHPDLTPLTVPPASLQRYVTELPEFRDDPEKFTEGKLEAIQKAWHEEFQDKTRD
jgi:FeS assembly protein IscX